jgi:hypothetical protein
MCGSHFLPCDGEQKRDPESNNGEHIDPMP